MKKIIQITAVGDDLYCLTEDGKIYSRKTISKWKEENNKIRKVRHTEYWEEIKEKLVKIEGIDNKIIK